MEPWEYEFDPYGRRIGIWEEKPLVYITDLRHSVVRTAYETRCRELGLKPWESLTAPQRVALDLELLERFGKDRFPMAARIRLKEWLYAAGT